MNPQFPRLKDNRRGPILKRNAISPIFSNFGSNPNEKQKNREKFVPFASSPIQLNRTLRTTQGKEFRDQFGNYIEKFGGLHNPGFSHNNLFDNSSNGWNKFLGIIKQTPTQENTVNVIKNMKAK